MRPDSWSKIVKTFNNCNFPQESSHGIAINIMGASQMVIIKRMKGFVIIETRQMPKQHFIIRLEVPEEVFIFVNSFRGGYP
jgi:hypothetical protein